MTTNRIESILRRHRRRALFDLVAPLVVMAGVSMAAAGVGRAGMITSAQTDEARERPARAECVHIAEAGRGRS